LANNLADELRKRTADARDVRRQVSLEARLTESSQRLAGWLAADDPSPSAVLLREEQLLQMIDVLDQLPEAQREALLLQHWHGWSLSEIAEQMQRTPTAVAGLLKRGLRTLRERML
jgi:RNA polymerase sigma-70 factor (ECF subfamily)